jgi:hypothetical protein
LDYGSSDPEEDRPEIGAFLGVGTALEAPSPLSIAGPTLVPFSTGRMHRSASPIGRNRSLPQGDPGPRQAAPDAPSTRLAPPTGGGSSVDPDAATG